MKNNNAPKSATRLRRVSKKSINSQCFHVKFEEYFFNFRKFG
jgi:hypothetical protein